MDRVYNKSEYLFLKENITSYKDVFSKLYYDNKDVINQILSEHTNKKDDLIKLIINSKLFNNNFDSNKIKYILTTDYISISFIDEFNNKTISVGYVKDYTTNLIELTVMEDGYQSIDDELFTFIIYNKIDSYKL